MYEGDYYLVTLEKEIEDRPLNTEVFGIAQGGKKRKQLRGAKLLLAKEQAKKAAATKKSPGSARSSGTSSARSKTSPRSSRPTGRSGIARPRFT